MRDDEDAKSDSVVLRSQPLHGSLLLPPASPLLPLPFPPLTGEHAWHGAEPGSPVVPSVRPKPAPPIPSLPPHPTLPPGSAADASGQVCDEPPLRRLQRRVRLGRAARHPRGQRAPALHPPRVRRSQPQLLSLPPQFFLAGESPCTADSREVLVRLCPWPSRQEVSPPSITSQVLKTFSKGKSLPGSQAGGNEEAFRGEPGLWDRSDGQQRWDNDGHRLPAGLPLLLPRGAAGLPADPVHGEGAADGVEQAVCNHR